MNEFELKPNRLSLTDTPEDIASKLSDGNPGAITVCCIILKESQENIDVIKYLLVFDTLQLYGSRLYMLWNDCCDRDMNKVYAVIDSLVAGDLTAEDINSHVDAGGRGLPFDFKQLSISRVKECRHLFMNGFCQKCGVPQSRAEG